MESWQIQPCKSSVYAFLNRTLMASLLQPQAGCIHYFDQLCRLFLVFLTGTLKLHCLVLPSHWDAGIPMQIRYLQLALALQNISSHDPLLNGVRIMLKSVWIRLTCVVNQLTQAHPDRRGLVTFREVSSKVGAINNRP